MKAVDRSAAAAVIAMIFLACGTAFAQEQTTPAQPPEKPQVGLFGSKGDVDLDFNFQFQYEVVNVQKEAFSPADRTEEPELHFQLNKYLFEPVITYKDHFKLVTQLEGNTDEVFVKKAYVEAPYWIEKYEGPAVTATWIKDYLVLTRLGIDYSFIRPDRMTETYPLNGTAFWRDQKQGISFTGKAVFSQFVPDAGALKKEEYSTMYANISFSNGYAIGATALGKDYSFLMIHDNANSASRNDSKEIGLAVGYKRSLDSPYEFTGKWPGKVDAMIFAVFDKLTEDDLEYLYDVTGYGDSRNDGRKRFGLNLDFRYDRFDMFFQYMLAVDGQLDRTGYYVQMSYDLDLRGTDLDLLFPSDVTALIRFNALDVDLEKSPFDSLTWDRQALTFAGIFKVNDHLTVKAELNFNNESTGSYQIANDEMLLQFCVEF